MENYLKKIKQENKRIILAENFSLNVIKYAQKTGVNLFLEIVLSKKFMPQITIPRKATDHFDPDLRFITFFDFSIGFLIKMPR